MSAGLWDFYDEEDIQRAYRVVDNMAFRFQEYTPPPQYQNPTPQPSKSVTTLAEIRELFSKGILEITKMAKEIKEEIGAISITTGSKLTTSDTPMRMARNQVDKVVEVTESQQGTLPLCTVAEEETKCEEVMTISCKMPSIVEAIQPPSVVDDKVIRKCGSTLQSQLTKMFGDSRRFELSVKLEKTTFATSYCDSGSNLSWMTYATAQSLGFRFKHFKDTQLSLEFADRPGIVALGILQDLVVTINNLPVRADFAVVGLGEEFDDTLILGKPLLCVARALLDVQEEDTELHLGDNTTTSQEETEMIANELDTGGAESAEEINLPPLPERVVTVKEELGAAESKEEMLEFLEEPPPVATVQTTMVVQEEVTTLDEDTIQNREVHELEDDPRFELCVETENMSLVETCHDSSIAETADFSLADTKDISLTIESQTRHGFCAEDILESAAMPRKGPDKPEDHKVSQFDKIVHHDIEDSLARIWSMSKKGNGFPWDTGISRELKLSDDHELDSRDYRVSNLLKPPLLFDHKSRGFLVKDGGKPVGIPRTGPDILSFYEFDQSQFLRFAGEGGCISYCDVIGSVTRPPEILLNVPVLC